MQLDQPLASTEALDMALSSSKCTQCQSICYFTYTAITEVTSLISSWHVYTLQAHYTLILIAIYGKKVNTHVKRSYTTLYTVHCSWFWGRDILGTSLSLSLAHTCFSSGKTKVVDFPWGRLWYTDQGKTGYMYGLDCRAAWTILFLPLAGCWFFKQGFCILLLAPQHTVSAHNL